MYSNINGASKQIFPLGISSSETVTIPGTTTYTWNRYNLVSETINDTSGIANEYEHRVDGFDNNFWWGEGYDGYDGMRIYYSTSFSTVSPKYFRLSSPSSILITDYLPNNRTALASLLKDKYWVPFAQWQDSTGYWADSAFIDSNDHTINNIILLNYGIYNDKITYVSQSYELFGKYYYTYKASGSIGTTVYSCGTYIDQVTSTSYNTYPDDSYTGGYWYIYQGSSTGPSTTTTSSITYNQIKAIQSSGTQYIDTGFKPNQDTRVVCDIEVIQISGYAPLFGARKAVKNMDFSTWAIDETRAQDGYGSNYDSSIAINLIGRNVIDKNKNVYIVNGTILYTHSEYTFQTAYPLFLFNINTSGSKTGSYTTYAKLYSCKIYDNGTLIRDYVPVSGSNGSVGLYDLVNKKFYGNSGTGTFTAIT